MATFPVDEWTPSGLHAPTFVRHLATFQSLTAARAFSRVASVIVSPHVVFVGVRDPAVSPSRVPLYLYTRGGERVYNLVAPYTAPATTSR